MITIITGCAPNLPWWRLRGMTDREIEAYNGRFLSRQTITEDHMSDVLDELNWLLADCKSEGDASGDFRQSKAVSAAIAEITRLRSTIEQLRQVAGAASLDGGLVDIKADIAKKKENPSHG